VGAQCNKLATVDLNWEHFGLDGRRAEKQTKTRMWGNAQRDGRPAEYRWHPLFNAAKFGDAHY